MIESAAKSRHSIARLKFNILCFLEGCIMSLTLKFEGALPIHKEKSC